MAYPAHPCCDPPTQMGVVHMKGRIIAVSVTHNRASVDEIEAAQRPSQQEAVDRVLAYVGLSEAFVWYTCHRAEVYLVTDDIAPGRELLNQFLTSVSDEVVNHLGHMESIRHWLRVAAGLESMVLGENQILGQVRDAYTDARQADAIVSAQNTSLREAAAEDVWETIVTGIDVFEPAYDEHQLPAPNGPYILDDEDCSPECSMSTPMTNE